MILFEKRAAIVLEKVLKALKNKEKFLLPLNVCPIVPDTFKKLNIEFDFIDISLNTLCMDENSVLKKLKYDKTIDGILFVKTFGIEMDAEPFFKQIKSINSNIFIINDMCPSIPLFNVNINNSYADMALFSSGYSKYVDIGYGGYAFLRNNQFKNIFDNQENSNDFLNYKDKIQKEIKLIKIHKKELNAIYQKELPSSIHLGKQFNNWRFSIIIDNKNEILNEIFKVKGLFASSHYPQVDFDYVDNPVQNSNTERIHNNILNLFNDFRFTKEKAYLVSHIINKYIKEVQE